LCRTFASFADLSPAERAETLGDLERPLRDLLRSKQG
jgi:hypothetical protein